MTETSLDPRFKVKVIATITRPNLVMYQAMHQCYSENFVLDEVYSKSESEYGDLLVKHLLAGNRGHYGILEHIPFTFAVDGFPHSVMQQLRTHRTGISFAVQSGRYTGKRISDVVMGVRSIEDVVYLRPVGHYDDRMGHKFDYHLEVRNRALGLAFALAQEYATNLEIGMSPEQARGMFPFDFRQSFVMSANLRTVLHLLDLRHKPNAQLEIQAFSRLLFNAVHPYVPEIMNWYSDKRLNKGILAP